MTDYDIKIDLSPYLPDSYLKENVYQTMDKVDYTSIIPIYSTIFIFNINCSTADLEYYNDPGYLLYGIKKQVSSSPTTYFDYKVPSTYFFDYPINKDNQIISPYTVVESYDAPNPVINDLLKKIGYDINLLNLIIQSSPNKIINFSYKVLNCVASISKNLKQVIYIFFNIKNLTEINYNNYNSVIYANSNYYNTFIYPYINTNPLIPLVSLNKNLNYGYDRNNFLATSTNYIEPVDFDDREIIKYYEKLDYKYMERREFFISQTNKLELLIYLSKNLKVFENFFINNKISNNNIMISNNEISKVYFSNSDYENKNLNSYTLTKLNNNYINNNISYSGKEKSYSFTLDNKISYIQKLIKTNEFKYTPYNDFIINTPSIYQMSKNYYINTYINININEQYKEDILFETNALLYKTLIIINPYLINLVYLLSQDIKLNVTSLFKDSNELKFGSSTDKINLYFVNPIKKTNTFYTNKYKIDFSFKIENKTVNYIIILGLCFISGNNINIKNVDVTRYTDTRTYILFTNKECSVSLCPQLFNLTNQVDVFEQKDIIELFDINILNTLISFNNKTFPTNNFRDVIYSNYYTLITLVKPYTNNLNLTNILNINITKINNFIKNLINISNNILNITDNNLLLNFTNTLTYDSNLELEKYIEDYNYFPQVQLEEFLPNTINKYKLFTNIPQDNNSLSTLPAGNYKIIKYKNFYPEYDFSVTSTQNDKIVFSINNIDEFLKNNFVLFILLPNNLVTDDKFIVELESENKEDYLYKTNYSCNIGSSPTKLYLVVSDSEGNPYVNTQNTIIGFELFNFYNSENGTNIAGIKYKVNLNLFYCTYLNFYQMIFLTTIFKNYTENNNSIINIDNTKLLLHSKDILKDIVYYDFLRFNYPADLTLIKKQFDTYDQEITDLLYFNKYFTNLLKTDIKRLIFIYNTNKIVISLKKIYYYLSNYLILEVKNPLYLNIINYLANLCLDISQVNYQLRTTFSKNNNYCQDLLKVLSEITILTPFETINYLISGTEFIKTYFQDKIDLTIKEIVFDIDFIESNPDASLEISNQYKIIKNLIKKFTLNQLILDQLTLDINQLDSEGIVHIITNSYPDLITSTARSLIKSIINFVHLISLNSKKINELINTVRLISTDITVDSIFLNGLNNNVVKNMFVYNNLYYNSLGINNFNIETFLNDYITCINYFSNPANNSPISYLFYVKSIDENIITYINNTIKYLNLINNYIVGIYKYDNNINIGLLPKINIMNPSAIGNFYYLITMFKQNYINMVSVVNQNKINIFQEFDLVISFFNNYIGSIEDYLFYIETQLYFTNLVSYNQNIFGDILKILNITEFYTMINQIIQLINQLSNGNQTVINEFLQVAYNNFNKNNFVLKNPNEELKNFKMIMKNFNFNKNNIYSILKNYILNSYIVTTEIPDLNDIINTITYQGDDIVIIRDYNILYPELSISSFNFYSELLLLVNNSIQIQIDILKHYYVNDYSFYKQLINYNYLDIKNIVVNITGINISYE